VRTCTQNDSALCFFHEDIGVPSTDCSHAFGAIFVSTYRPKRLANNTTRTAKVTIAATATPSLFAVKESQFKPAPPALLADCIGPHSILRNAVMLVAVTPLLRCRTVTGLRHPGGIDVEALGRPVTRATCPQRRQKRLIGQKSLESSRLERSPTLWSPTASQMSKDKHESAHSPG
jgi:hypothetical protein